MRWWQLYYAIHDTHLLRKDKRFKEVGYEVLLLASWFIETPIYRLNSVDRACAWGKAVAIILNQPSVAEPYIERTRREIQAFVERLEPLLSKTGAGTSPRNLNLIHSLLINRFQPQQVWEMELWEIAEILLGFYYIEKNARLNR